jgi:hypothetical protein
MSKNTGVVDVAIRAALRFEVSDCAKYGVNHVAPRQPSGTGMATNKNRAGDFPTRFVFTVRMNGRLT